MKTISVTQPINLKVVKLELDFTTLIPETPRQEKVREIKIPKINFSRRVSVVPPPPQIKNNSHQKRDVKELVEELLDELYADRRDWSSTSGVDYSHGSTSLPSVASSQSISYDQTDAIERSYLDSLDVKDLQKQLVEWEVRLRVTGERLARSVRARDRLRRQQKRLCAAFTVLLRHITGETGARFGLAPAGNEGPGEGGYAEWLHAMRLVARLPAGVPQHFRRKLWISLADRHLSARGIDWPVAESACFRGTAQPDDTELGAQIIKDLHRTGCSLFCGTEGRENQAMLRRVLLAYARWNKDVGYCQGFNMLAAIILEVMEKSESDSLKVMIYLVEAVLPEGYFADDLRGLSADMAAFRDLLRLRIPRLANHMDHLQRISDGGGVEPPLPDVFTMQWFLTLYATWLPRESLLRIWDLILLDGNEILLLTALAIWDMLQDRILSARSADEFYSCMGGGAGAVYQAGESLVARVVSYDSVPELPRLRSLHRYRVTPPAAPVTAPVCQPPLHSAMQSISKRGLRLFYSEDEGDSSDDGNKMALATVIPRREDRLGAGDRLSLDIGALKRQYVRLRERQRQAHVILAAACARHAAVGVPTSPTSLTVNNLLLGKSAIVSSRGRRLGPPPGAVPPSRQALASREKPTSPTSQARSNETISWNEEKSRKTLSRRNSVKWKDIKKDKTTEKVRKASIDLDEVGDGIIVSEREADEMIASLRSRSSSESSSYSSHSASSTDTSLCDENERGSDSEPDIPDDNTGKGKTSTKVSKHVSASTKEKKKTLSPNVSDCKISPSTFIKNTKPSRALNIKEPKKTSYTIEKEASLNLSPVLKEPSLSPCTFTKNVSYLNSPTIKESKISPNNTTKDFTRVNSPIVRNPKISPEISTEVTVKDISDYLGSAAGEPLRTYIDGFESKLNENLTTRTEMDSYKPISPFKSRSPYSEFGSEKGEVLLRLKSEEYSRSSESVRSTKPSKNLTDLSPIDLSPCNFGIGYKSPYNYDFETNFKRPSTSKLDLSARPPDIIDSLTMYPNFVPDIDLSEKNVSDLDSPSRSPGAESIVVSEDEPPIPLRIDKYFEHSPEFFGARVTDPNNSEIPNRRAAKRLSRVPKKPDSLTLQSSHNDKILKTEVERASSLPQSHSFAKEISLSPDDQEQHAPDISEKIYDGHFAIKNIKQESLDKTPENKIFSPKDYALRSGRKNSERALQIIQENSKILNRILTKQNANNNKTDDTKSSENLIDVMKPSSSEIHKYSVKTNFTDCSFLKESTSDSLIVHRKRNINNDANDKNEFVRVRPISIDDPFSLEIREGISHNPEFQIKCIKSPSSECLGNKTDLYGWENKGFLAKCDFKNLLSKPEKYEFDASNKEIPESLGHGDLTTDPKPASISDWACNSVPGESKTSVTLPSSTEPKDNSMYERRFTSDDYNYPLSSKYNDFVLSKASDICSKTAGQGPKICNSSLKTDNSQVSEFAHVVTSSISFTYEASADDDSPTGAKTNSSDTLCQIASLDQVSTPISPKIFPNRETPTLPKDYLEKSDKFKLESDDTCSAITSLIETDTLSSLSYPRSPSTGSYHPFPTRPAMRMPKELGVRLGMYPKDAIPSPPK